MGMEPTPISNLHIVTGHAVEGEPGRMYATIRAVAAEPHGPYGGTVSRIDYLNGRATGISLRAFERRTHERAAASALFDAVRASGLLEKMTSPASRERVGIGRTQIFINNRSRGIEFDSEKAPVEAQAALDAYAAYEKLASATQSDFGYRPL